MDDQTSIGARLRVLRRWRGLTQTELAGLAGVSQGWLSLVERGLQPLDRRSHIAAIASALRVSEFDLVGGPHLSDDPVQAGPHNAIPALRVALEANRLQSPTVDRARSLPELVSETTRLYSQCYLACDYANLGKDLPDVIDELHVHVADPADEAAHRIALETLVEACMYAWSLVNSLGYQDLAHVAANRAAEAAAFLDDPVQIGKAEFMRILTIPRAGSWDRPLIAAERAANDLEPHAREPLDFAVLGMLTLTASLSAAAVRNRANAAHWLDQAEQLAARVPDDPPSNWQRFSMTNVNIWQVSVGLELGETGGAVLQKARMVNLNKLKTALARKADFLADVGRGLAREKATRHQAVKWLRQAEDTAPQRIRNSNPVRHTVEVLHTQSLASAVGVELRGMMARMRIPH